VNAACAYRNSAHVNIQEVTALIKLVVKEPEYHPGPGRRIVSISDSKVAGGAFTKGRSSSKRLNPVLRGVLGWTELRSFEVVLCWVCSAMNVADEPSRHKPLRSPLVPSFQLVRDLARPADGRSHAAWPSDRQVCFLKVFTGAGVFPAAMQERGIPTSTLFEAFPEKSEYEFDLMRGKFSTTTAGRVGRQVWLCPLRDSVQNLFVFPEAPVQVTDVSPRSRPYPGGTESYRDGIT
jgi:hypothetical protein